MLRVRPETESAKLPQERGVVLASWGQGSGERTVGSAQPGPGWPLSALRPSLSWLSIRGQDKRSPLNPGLMNLPMPSWGHEDRSQPGLPSQAPSSLSPWRMHATAFY